MTVGPFYYGMSFTFMTDVTAAAFASIAIFGYIKGMSRRSLSWLFVGALVGVAATWARQTHLCVIVLPAIACAGIGWRQNRLTRAAIEILIAVGIPIASFIVFELGWIVPGNEGRVHIVDVDSYDLRWARTTILFAYGGGLLLGLVALPLLPLLLASGFTQQCKQNRRWVLVPALIVLSIWAGMFAASGGRAYLTQATGYIVYNAHLGPMLLGDQNDPGRWSDMGDVRWPVFVWQLLTVGAILTCTILAGHAGRTFHRLAQNWQSTDEDQDVDSRRSWILAGLLTCFAAAVTGLLLYVEMVYDRYWMLCYPMLFTWIGAVASSEPREASQLPKLALISACTIALLMFAMSFIFVHDFLAWNHTRYQQCEAWLADGLEPKDFDAGNGINGWYRTHEDIETHYREGDTTRFWRGLATHALAIGPREGWAVEKKLEWDSWAVGGTRYLFVLVRDASADSQE